MASVFWTFVGPFGHDLALLALMVLPVGWLLGRAGRSFSEWLSPARNQ